MLIKNITTALVLVKYLTEYATLISLECFIAAMRDLINQASLGQRM
jgi:hypothetical protein